MVNAVSHMLAHNVSSTKAKKRGYREKNSKKKEINRLEFKGAR